MALMDFRFDRAAAVETVSVILDLKKNSLWCTLFASDKIRASMEEMGCLIGLLSSVLSFSIISVVMLEDRSTEGSGHDILIWVHGFVVFWIGGGWCVSGVGVVVVVSCGRWVAVVGLFWFWLGVIV